MKVSFIKQFVGTIKESFEAGKQGHMFAVNIALQTSTPIAVFDDVPVLVNNNALVLIANIPSFIAGALMAYTSNGNSLIIVNEEFVKLPKYVQEAFYCHELGHVVNKHTTNKLDLIKRGLGFKSTRLKEFQADFYSASRGYQMYQAIEYIADNYLGYTSEIKARLQYLKDCNLHIVKGDI